MFELRVLNFFINELLGFWVGRSHFSHREIKYDQKD